MLCSPAVGAQLVSLNRWRGQVAAPPYDKPMGYFELIRFIVKTEGWQRLYRGMPSAISGTGLSWALYFGSTAASGPCGRGAPLGARALTARRRAGQVERSVQALAAERTPEALRAGREAGRGRADARGRDGRGAHDDCREPDLGDQHTPQARRGEAQGHRRGEGGACARAACHPLRTSSTAFLHCPCAAAVLAGCDGRSVALAVPA
jgi:hypothetical protein